MFRSSRDDAKKSQWHTIFDLKKNIKRNTRIDNTNKYT